MAVTAPSIPATATPVANASGQNVSATVTGGTVQTVVALPPAGGPGVPTPAIPASTVAATNTTGAPVLVQITGGTTTVISVNGTTVATTTPANVVVPAGGTIAITYSVVPTSWVWSAAVAGASGNPLSSPQQLPIPPGCSAELFYTVAPTWTWASAQPTSYSPGYSAYNTQAEGPGYDPNTAMPYARHPVASFTNLGTGVSN